MCIVSLLLASVPIELISLTFFYSERTLSLLFSAQTNNQIQSAQFSQQEQQIPIASIPSNAGHQSSIRSFFGILPARQSSPSSIISSSSSTPLDTPTYATALSSLCPVTNCEDCSAPLGNIGDANGVDMDMMDVDVANGGNYACEQCGKHVCHGCAVSNLGEQRRCLNCAGRYEKRWVGGLGWV